MKGNLNELYNELEEQRKKEKIQNFFNRFGIWFLVAVASMLLGAAIYTWHDNHKKNSALYYSDMYERAKQLIVSGNTGEGLKELKNIIKHGPQNYKAMAYFIMAEHFMSRNNLKEVKSIYSDIISTKKIDPFYKGLAQLNLIRLKLDHEKQTKNTLSAHKVDLEKITNNELKPLVLEVKGYVFYQLGEMKQARDLFIQIAQMPNIDSNLRQRVQAMTRLISMKIDKEK